MNVFFNIAADILLIVTVVIGFSRFSDTRRGNRVNLVVMTLALIFMILSQWFQLAFIWAIGMLLAIYVYHRDFMKSKSS